MADPRPMQPDSQADSAAWGEGSRTSQPRMADTSVSLRSNPESLPEQIDRYQVRSLLGTGGFGRVYLAFDPVIKREVAVKVPGRAEGWSDREKDGFLDEARRAARLRHPHIVTIYDAGKCPEFGVYIVLEYVTGQTLAEYQKRNAITIDLCVRIITQVADAVHESQKQGIIHRDLKPSNIMLDEKGNIRVTDFGLALPEDCQASERGTSARRKIGHLELGRDSVRVPHGATTVSRQRVPEDSERNHGARAEAASADQRSHPHKTGRNLPEVSLQVHFRPVSNEP